MKPWAAALVCAAAGLLVGGYVTVLIERVPASRTISGPFGELTRRPLGRCPHRAARLPAADIVPLLGWARTGGRRSQLAFGPFMLAGAIAVITASGLR